MIHVGFLDIAHVVGSAQAFNGRNLVTLCFNCEDRAGVDGFVVEQHGARTAGTTITYFLGSGRVQSIAQGIEQRDTRFNG